ncbi:hypothetical protein [Streptomyces sp. JNUCC 63]
MSSPAQHTPTQTAETPSGPSAGHEEAPLSPHRRDWHTFTVTIPVGRAVSTVTQAATTPVRVAQRVLPAKGGLPLYLGLGTLGAVGILEWPVAAGIAIGYAVLRRGGVLTPAPATPAPAPEAETRTTAGKDATA